MFGELSPSQYGLVLDSLSEGVCVVNREWKITAFNREAERITGVPREKAVGLQFDDIFQSDICKCREVLEEVMTRGEALRDVATVISRGDEGRVPLRVNASPLWDADRRTRGVVATFRDVSDVELLRRELRREYTFGDIVSKAPRIRRILDVLPDVAASDSVILILGPSGTGKELLARAIHTCSLRAGGPFVAVNCGALPDTLLESELFGYEKGAFTDAKASKPGRFARAEKGTLFLDEIGDLSAAMQVKLLRVLQEKEYEPLGGTHPVKADVRVIAATNRDLAAMVAAGEFRTDLYYRLNVMEIALPPLAERREDIPLLIEHFIERYNAEKGRHIQGVTPEALRRLVEHDYPGNIRELENLIERAFILCKADRITEACLPTHVRTPQFHLVVAPPDEPESEPESEQDRILSALRAHDGRRDQTAAALGMDKSTLWRKMKKFGIRFPVNREKPKGDGPAPDSLWISRPRRR